MDCEIKLAECEAYSIEKSCDHFYQGQKIKVPVFSEEDVIGITVIAVFLATATWFAMRGYHEPFFFLLVPMLFSLAVGVMTKKIYERFTEERTFITAFLHRIYALTIATPFQKL